MNHSQMAKRKLMLLEELESLLTKYNAEIWPTSEDEVAVELVGETTTYFMSLNGSILAGRIKGLKT